MDDENASPYGGSLTSGSANAPASASNTIAAPAPATPASISSAAAAAGLATPTTSTTSLNGESSSNISTVRSVPGFGTLQQQPGMSTPATPAGQQQQQPNGIQQQNGATIGGKTFVTKRTRLSGLPPPTYSPLGAASPSLSSNAPSFPPNASSSSQPSSSQSTPSASPQSTTSPLPPTGGVTYTSNQALPAHPPSSGAGSYSQQGAHSTTNAHLYPALHLHPLNETFIPKQISLYPSGPHNRIKIGRQTNAKTVPAPNNGYFDSKVLSRQHAEVWCENGKVYIKDVKSSNGTFINGERLSPEAVESDIFELHSNDMVEFGIDITSEDGKTIVHHKVAARCFLIMNAEDAVATSRNYASYYREMGDSPMHRRAGLGGQKGLPGSNMNLDQVLNRLQTELQKSRETGAELGTLTSTIGEIHETLGGNLPGPPLPAYRVPPYVPPNPNAPPPAQQAAQQAQQQAQTQQLLQTLQSQLQETQNALNGHVERIKGLEDLLSEQERMKVELKEVKDRMDESRSELERLRDSQQRSSIRNVSSVLEDDDDKDFDNDLEDDKEDEMDSSDDMETIRLGSRSDNGTAYGDDNATSANNRREDLGGTKAEALLASQTKLEEENAALSSRMEALSTELSAASQLSSSLKNQYAQAAETIRGLEDKVNTLEKALHAPPSSTKAEKRSVPSPSKPSTSTGIEDVMREVENRFTDWKKSFEDSIKQERQSWEEERERFRNIVQDWEKRSNSLAQQQSSSGGLKKKRRSKASTVSTSSGDDLSDEYSEDGSSDRMEEGFVSPVTDDSGSPSRDQKRASVISKDFQATTQNEDEASDIITAMPKRPRSRRRKRAPDPTSIESKESSSTSESSQEQRAKRPGMAQRNGADQSEDGGSQPNRRKSWIPFSKSFTGDYPNKVAAEKNVGTSSERAVKKRKDAGVLDHPAIPFASAAGVVVIGYLAYTAIVQHQK